MNDTVIKVEDISKLYRLGELHKQTNSFRDKVTQSLYNLLRKNNKSTVGYQSSGGSIFALKGISFEVNKGEVLGIIGRNGAGKSTLLKILSRITRPTEGKAAIIGRVGSLLEVGTGFHPELTGKENIFLSGIILGMKRAEIRKKFEEIVEFSGIEKFIDTPVKRYSSGMYVRLAFSVAAHLEPEILLIDEVLAVGDIAFQKKCLGKMENISTKGRTVLFVSHNIGSVRSLCSRGIYLEDGKIKKMGDIDSVCNSYLKETHNLGEQYIEQGVSVKVNIWDETGRKLNDWRYGDEMLVEVDVESEEEIAFPSVDISFYRTDGIKIFSILGDKALGTRNFARTQKFKIVFKILNTGFTVREVYMDVGVRSGQSKYIALLRQVAMIPISTAGLVESYPNDAVFCPPIKVNIVQ